MWGVLTAQLRPHLVRCTRCSCPLLPPRYNAKLREKAKKEEAKRMREFVEAAQRTDPRVAARREEERAERERKKAEKEAARRAAEEAEAQRRADEEAARWVEGRGRAGAAGADDLWAQLAARPAVGRAWLVAEPTGASAQR